MFIHVPEQLVSEQPTRDAFGKEYLASSAGSEDHEYPSYQDWAISNVLELEVAKAEPTTQNTFGTCSEVKISAVMMVVDADILSESGERSDGDKKETHSEATDDKVDVFTRCLAHTENVNDSQDLGGPQAVAMKRDDFDAATVMNMNASTDEAASGSIVDNIKTDENLVDGQAPGAVKIDNATLCFHIAFHAKDERRCPVLTMFGFAWSQTFWVLKWTCETTSVICGDALNVTLGL
ncbi:hypothetical protein BJ742DRAFT_744548 [Cladochytrium replicatum]|nr:hypothetical protein BJ742DRAFT_744548 [Cladochytrium replicatum]